MLPEHGKHRQRQLVVNNIDDTVFAFFERLRKAAYQLIVHLISFVKITRPTPENITSSMASVWEHVNA
jgi:hypothetical protein